MATARERFMAKVIPTGGCWLWSAATDRDGYGHFYLGDRVVKAHRAAYELFVGPIPEGLEIDHACHTRDMACRSARECPHRRCVNPAHLEVVTHTENALRGRAFVAVNAAKTHCAHDHPFNQANTYWRAGGRRGCRACNLEAVRRYRARKKVAA